MNIIPNELSTYEALNSFVENINEEGDFKNPVVEKLLINALTDESSVISRNPIEDDIQTIIDKHIPISLSNCLINAFSHSKYESKTNYCNHKRYCIFRNYCSDEFFYE